MVPRFSLRGAGFPFLVGALFLLATAIAVVLSGINISLWSHKRARYSTSAIGKIGAWLCAVISYAL